MIRLMLILATIFVLFFTVIVVTPGLIEDNGYILISMGDTAIESTVVSAVFLLIAAAFVIALIYILIKMVLRIGSTSWHKVVFSNQRRGQKLFLQGVNAYLLSDYQKSEELMAKCAESSQMTETAWLTAAKASIARNEPGNAKHYLNLIEMNKTKSTPLLETLSLKVQLLIQQGLLAQARHLLDENHKLVGHDYHLLKAEIELCLAESRFPSAIDHINQAKKQKAITTDEITHWQNVAYKGQFEQLFEQSGLEGVNQYWQSLPKKTRQSDAVFIAYANVLASNKLTDPLIDLIHPVIKKDVEKTLLDAIKVLPFSNVQPLIAIIQKHVQKQPESTKWLSALGHIAASSKDWHIAEGAFKKLFELEESKSDLARYADVLHHMGHHKDANSVYQKVIAPTTAIALPQKV